MSEINDLLNDIERLRGNLIELINQKHEDLSDLEILNASQILNAAIVKYNKLISKKL